MWAFIVVIVVVVGTAAGITYVQTPTYQASAKVLVGQKEDVTHENLGGEVAGLQQLTRTLTEAVSSRHIAEGVIRRLDLQMTPENFLGNLRVQQVGETQFIQLVYRDTDPQRAQQVANTTADVFSNQVSEVSPEASGITATVWERAATPQSPESPKPLLYILLALVLGAILGLGLVLLLDYGDNSWRSLEEVEQVTGVPAFSVIPKFDVRNKVPKSKFFRSLLVTISEPNSDVTEAYLTLRTSLLYARIGEDHTPKVIELTSASSYEGRSTACANLGVVLAQADKNVLLVDCNFRSPVLHKIFGLPNTRGLTNALAEEHRPQELWQEVLPGLKILPVGPVPPNPAKLLSSRRFTEFLNQSSREFDYVLLDTPPIELAVDPLIIAGQSDGVLFVLDTQQTLRRKAWRGVHSLETVGANIFGTVVYTDGAFRDN